MDGTNIARYLAVAAISLALIAVAGQLTQPVKIQAQEEAEEYATSRYFAPVSIPLDGIKLKDGQFILLTDTTPFTSEAHVAMVLPCDDEGNPKAKLVAGVAPNLAPVDLGAVLELSTMGDTCVYHGEAGEDADVTDWALLNTSGAGLRFKDNHSVSIFLIHKGTLGE